jgi:glycyl-tRNA synthetase beta chain
MGELVFEIGSEEMPARFLPGLGDELRRLVSAGLEQAMIDFEEIRIFSTPRRLAVRVTGLAETQRMEEETVTGPPAAIAFQDGKPTKAAEGFAKGQGADVSEAYVLETEKGEYLALDRRVGGNPVSELLPSVLEKAVTSLSFPKKMRWGSGEFTFGRPMRWILALHGADVVPLEVAGVRSGRETFGHREMGPGPFQVPAAEEYLAVLREQGKVAADPEERRREITASAEELAASVGGRPAWNESLLSEVVGLVEHPGVILGRYDESFLEVPRRVLLTTMENHQKSFGVQDEKGMLLPYFLSTLNIDPPDPALVTRGWERVLRARLEDARFYWKTDASTGFEAWLQELDNVIFIGPLGTMGDKSRRLEVLCAYLAERLSPVIKEDMVRAGRLAKADLVSEMVGEFDELQGIMGGIYAGRLGEKPVVAEALTEQYLPTGPESEVPETVSGALLSMADKADTICGCFGLKMIPTGAHDPNALRRQALGICRIVVRHGFRLDLGRFLSAALAGYGDIDWKLPPEEAMDRMLEFFAGRLRAHYTAKGYETLVVEAALGAGFDDLWALDARIAALRDFSREPDFEQSALTFKRAANIIIKQGAEAGRPLTGEYQRSLLKEPKEIALADLLEETGDEWRRNWEKDDFAALMGMLRRLRPAVDDFFDHVMVMCEDADLRRNRLDLLKALVDRLGRLADFNALQI